MSVVVNKVEGINNMSVVVFGASGGIGQQAVKQALERGFTVKAFVRNASSLDSAAHKNLDLVTGNVFNFDDVLRAVDGQEAVISCLGSRTPQQEDPVASAGIKHILRAMNEVGCKRLLSVSSIGVGDPAEYPWYIRWLLIEGLFKRFVPHQYRDISMMEQIVKSSNVDWTLVRPTTLTNGSPTNQYAVYADARRAVKIWITRADVADFLIRHVNSTTYRQKIVHLGSSFFNRKNQSIAEPLR